MNKIQALILDVDGVIVGEKIGFNSPHPHPDVVSALKEIQNKGIPVSLCTAKPHFAISKEITDADLDNAHIADGGGVIISPLENKIIKQNNLPTESAVRVIQAFLDAGVYVEFYTVDNYVIQKSQAGEITQKHNHVIQAEPMQVDSLVEAAKESQITKIMPIAVDEADKENLNKIFEPFKNELVMSWGVHPVILPLQFGIVTAPGISKKQGAMEISQATGVSLENTLGVGDSGSDWQFIEMCGYGAAMGNAKQDLKDLVVTKGEDESFVGPSVDENGILEIFKYFELL
ncbi:MAG: HAD hydrolase family protein [Candidatus Pacebacteria bacterium]|jgi:Cof subfamily protein (haloacid dehalogenase superfamily)|nr:HAD hydrolase family protein [Candidatus Paceibacterota bacterium]MBT6921778.1 HAD hydrolase family protein [Candidatus Paceibacterota bacterium]